MIQLTPAWFPLTPHPVQVAAWRCKARFVALPCGRGSGKTLISRRRLVRFLPITKAWPDPMYFYAAPTRQQAKRLAWEKVLSLIPEPWIAGVPNLSDMMVKTVWGSRLFVVGLDKPQRIEGDQWDGAVIDESCDIRPGAFNKNISPALVHRYAWCWRIGVPKRAGIGAREYRQFCEAAKAGELSDAAHFWWPSDGSDGNLSIVPEDVLRERRQGMDPRDYDEQFRGRWQSAGGQIFYAFSREESVRPCSYDRTLAIIVGSDFNVNPMAWVLGHRRDGNGTTTIEWFDEIFDRDTNTESTLKKVASRYASHTAGWQFFGDATSSARKSSASKSDYAHIVDSVAFKKMGRTVHYPKSNPPHRDRFAACNAMFLNAEGQRRMFVDPRCKNLIRDLEMRHYKSGTMEPEDGPDDGHITDAMGYYVYLRHPVRVRLDEVVGARVGSTK